jgi:hypothetical protein
MQRRGWIIGVSIVLGIVLACALLPIGVVGMIAFAGRGDSSPLPASQWREQVVSGQGIDRALGDQEAAIASAKERAGLQDALVVRYRATGSLRDLLLGNLEQMRQPSDPLGVRDLLHPSGPKLEYRMP